MVTLKDKVGNGTLIGHLNLFGSKGNGEGVAYE
jgi:hypothetical protein